MNATTANQDSVDEAIHAGCAGYLGILAGLSLKLHLGSPTKWPKTDWFATREQPYTASTAICTSSCPLLVS